MTDMSFTRSKMARSRTLRIGERSSHSSTLVDVTPGTVYAIATRNRRMNLLIVSLLINMREVPINPSAVRQKHFTEIKQIWANKWRNSERGKRFIQIYKSSPSDSFLRTISSHTISRKSASIISQLLTEHIPLNAYLRRINKVDTASCPSC